MRHWIFQSSPKRYRIVEAISQVHKHDNRMVWHTQASRAPNIHIDDRVYIWVSSPIAALVGTAEVETEPDFMTEPAWEKALWIRPDSGPKPSRQVGLRIIQILAERIPRRAIKSNSVLAGNSFFQDRPLAIGTNFPLTLDEATELDRMIDGCQRGGALLGTAPRF